MTAQAALATKFPEGAVAEPDPVLEVADGQLADRVATVVGVQGDGAVFTVGDEGVVAPVGPQGGLHADKAGAAHHQPLACQPGLGDLGDAAVGVVDVDPGAVGV